MDATEPVPVKELHGTVRRGIYGEGTKSEREAVFVDTGRDSFLLRRRGGPAYGDKALDRYVGRTITCSGFLLGTTLLAEKIRTVD
ncbi:MAG: hypothetical protein KDJ88_13070 [Bauldia sp.]|nr:hypothetical protein [Bauldia sp.]